MVYKVYKDSLYVYRDKREYRVIIIYESHYSDLIIWQFCKVPAHG